MEQHPLTGVTTTSASPRILIVEDDSKTATFLGKGLQENGFEVVIRSTGPTGIAEALGNAYELIILDVGLPGKDGWQVLEHLRAAGILTPVFFLTARDGINDRVRGLEKGADDYLIKPFAFAELLARVHLILRRRSNRPSTLLKVADLTLDLATQKAYRNGQRIDISATELALLNVLMKNSPATVPRRLLVELVWDMHFDSKTNIVEVTIKRLRAKIDDPFPVKLIHTVRGIGYACSSD